MVSVDTAVPSLPPGLDPALVRPERGRSRIR